MAIIVLKAWYLDSVLSASQVQNTPPDLRLSRTGLLKTGMRGDFLDDVDQVQNSRWFQRYLEGELVEFYIEGSGAYSISNLDLISREMYFNKRNTLHAVQPLIYFCAQSLLPDSSQAIGRALEQILEGVNRKHKPILPLQLDRTPPQTEGLVPIDAALLRKLKQALLVIADITPVAASATGRPLPSPQVCVEVGYALQSKRPEQIILVHLHREGVSGPFPFEVESSSLLQIQDPGKVSELLSAEVLKQLQRSRLIQR